MAIQSTTPDTPVRSRSRNPASGNNHEQRVPGQSADWMASGNQVIEATAAAEQEQEARREAMSESRGQPQRFRLGKGERADIVILDEDLGPGFWEYDLTWDPDFRRNRPNSNRPYDQYVISCKEFEADPLMERGKSPYWVVYVSVIDMRSGTSSQGKPYANTRKLMPLKGDCLNMLMEIRRQRQAAGENLRGVQLVMNRGTDDKSLKTGLPMFVARHSEDDIMQTFSHEEKKNEKGEVFLPANADCFPYDYSAIWSKPSAESIRLRFGLGGSTALGSNSAFENAFGAQSSTPAQQSNGGGIRSAAQPAAQQPFEQDLSQSTETPASTTAELDDEIPF